MLRKKKFVLLISFTIFVLFYVLATTDWTEFLFIPKINSASVEILCYDERADLNNSVLPLLNESAVAKSTSIFFVETSCNGGQLDLNARQACAIESAAKLNPESEVYLLVPSPVKFTDFNEHIKRLNSYRNIYLRHIDMNMYFENTPLARFYRRQTLKSSAWPKSHASDILRYTTLWKFGGYYVDLDVILLKPFNGTMNFAGAEDDEDIAAGFLSFSYQHAMANISIEDIRRNFKGWIWGHNGPGVITRSLHKYCGVKKISQMTPEQCNGFKVFDPSIFYPIPWKSWKQYFSTNQTEIDDIMSKLNTSMAIHVWNFHSKSRKAIVGSNQPYVTLASKFCPEVYSSLDKFF